MITTKENLNIKIDRSVKEAAAQLLANMGLDHTTAIEMYYRQIIKERRLPFQPEASLTLDEQIIAVIKSKNIPLINLETNEKGQIIIDKNKHPDLYDWAVNG
ncbi:MAG: type II toxin-antitoxin system RelB/DinJ family antitoxin [Oscillospiraceae bacterium]|nr:type II toxin-antitoxin system RelB/DinJ family antitoxin [Oscillospiraceae bacterium]